MESENINGRMVISIRENSKTHSSMELENRNLQTETTILESLEMENIKDKEHLKALINLSMSVCLKMD